MSAARLSQRHSLLHAEVDFLMSFLHLRKQAWSRTLVLCWAWAPSPIEPWMVGSPNARMVMTATIAAAIAKTCVIGLFSLNSKGCKDRTVQACRGIRVNPQACQVASGEHPQKDNVNADECLAGVPRRQIIRPSARPRRFLMPLPILVCSAE
jgi:hypothetical protein